MVLLAKTKIDAIIQDNQLLKNEVQEQAKRIVELEALEVTLRAKQETLLEQLRLALQRRFGISSEQSSPEQLRLFNEPEVIEEIAQLEPAAETVVKEHTRKAKGLREAQLEDLEVEEVHHPLSADEQNCPSCSEPLHVVTTKLLRKELKVIPLKVVCVHHIGYVCSCRSCERNATTTPVITSTMPVPAFPNGLGSPSIVAYIINGKYVESLPLYRQETMFARLGIEISRQTMANWVIKGADHLKIIYERLKAHLLSRDILHADETTLQVLNEEAREPQTKSYMWVYRTGRDGLPPIVLFEYTETRASKHPLLFLKDYKHYLNADGYSVYDMLPGIILIGCWAHARRKFTDVLKPLPAKAQKGSSALEGLAFCNKIFEIERDLIDSTHEERRVARLERSTVVLGEFKKWLHENAITVAPSGGTGKAIAYCLNQWDKLTAFLQDGRLEIDNNRAERSIKPFVMGRKNWLFANTPKGATASAIIYSIVETAKENNLNPSPYLQYLFEQLPNIDKTDLNAIDRLLPTSAELPQELRMPASRRPQAAS